MTNNHQIVDYDAVLDAKFGKLARNKWKAPVVKLC